MQFGGGGGGAAVEWEVGYFSKFGNFGGCLLLEMGGKIFKKWSGPPPPRVA